MISFQNIFGTDDGQIPVGASIQSASLAYNVSNSGETANVHDVTVDWAETVTFDSFGGDVGVQAADHGSLVGLGHGEIGTNLVDVTLNLASCSNDPTRNHGWVFFPSGGGGVDFRSSEWHAIVERPKLTVVFSFEETVTPVPTLTLKPTARTSPAPIFTLTPPTHTPVPTLPIPTPTSTPIPLPTITPQATGVTVTLPSPTEITPPVSVVPTPALVATPLPEATAPPGETGGGCYAPYGIARVDASWLLVGLFSLPLVWTKRRSQSTADTIWE